MDKYLLSACCTLFLISCSTIKLDRDIQINSQPSGAKVEVLDPESNEMIVLGKTPLNVSGKSIKEVLLKEHDFLSFKVSTPGYIVENLIIDTKLRKHVSYKTNLKKVEAWNDKNSNLSSVVANQLTMQVQEINQEIIKKDFKSALSKTQGLIKQYPKAHVYYDMKGSIHYLMGNKEESLASYKKSLLLNPDNIKSKEMIVRIKEMK